MYKSILSVAEVSYLHDERLGSRIFVESTMLPQLILFQTFDFRLSNVEVAK